MEICNNGGCRSWARKTIHDLRRRSESSQEWFEAFLDHRRVQQAAIESERQRNTQLLQALNDKDVAGPQPPEAVTTQLIRLYNITSELPTLQQWTDENIQDESRSCGHRAAGVLGLTACNVLLCQPCHDETLECRMLVNWHVRECAYCHRICALLPLPKQVIHPGWQEIARIADLVREGLNRLI
ncbi:hypothetical protein LTR70_010540 [Exophiala xenobiotica]|uniref:Uncharacterized protein n=1 Tax=Lithohypha guttulata TaxID=1690604 RepID=A0ABR0JTQ0_9EURO|nr:hypothetical protein LTR24_010516 [Lithohypha guttulata]KAK5309177.1 hypothetical protein LTR70_010540 [Exophiala xenobiotica]